MKTCSKCKQTKELSEFYKKTETTKQSYCKTCLLIFQKARWNARKIKAIMHKGGACESCGYDKNYAVLQFHHIDPAGKEFDGNKIRQLAWETVLLEIGKCQLLCSNCHTELHNPQCTMASVAGLEPATYCLEGSYSSD